MADSQIAWTKGPPTNLNELFDFYHNYVKPLYASVQVDNQLPSETLFELNAALDHLSRLWVYPGETQQHAIAKAYSHFKRACFDVFKLEVKKTTEEYQTLTAIDTSVIDNGDFDRELHRLYNKIKSRATKARQMEGQPDESDAVPAFELWESVYVDCVAFHQNFFSHDRIKWAKRRGVILSVKRRAGDIAIGLITGLITGGLFWWFTPRQTTPTSPIRPLGSLPGKAAPTPTVPSPSPQGSKAPRPLPPEAHPRTPEGRSGGATPPR